MRNYEKIIAALSASVLCAGAFFFACGSHSRVPGGVEVNGTCVGGKTYAAAAELLRRGSEERIRNNTLTICAGGRAYVYAYPQINYSDDVFCVLRGAERGGRYTSHTEYYLVGAEEIAASVCRDAGRAVRQAEVVFSAEGEPFFYSAGEDGAECDKARLLDDIRKSLNGSFGRVTVSSRTVKPSVGEEELRAKTRLLCRFTTYYDEDNAARSHNIRLACAGINGSIVGAGGTFSFNGTVGERTPSRGFKKAKIISDGRYVDGYGGGVCQVSTTLYNAALLSGLKIREQHAHSLAVGYVAPSRDAMVSGSACDLRFTNNRSANVYIRMSAGDGAVVCSIYGESDGWNYSFESVTLPSEPGDEGLRSEGYLVCERDGAEVKKLVRRDSYSPVGKSAPDRAEEDGKRDGAAARAAVGTQGGQRKKLPFYNEYVQNH